MKVSHIVYQCDGFNTYKKVETSYIGDNKKNSTIV